MRAKRSQPSLTTRASTPTVIRRPQRPQHPQRPQRPQRPQPQPRQQLPLLRRLLRGMKPIMKSVAATARATAPSTATATSTTMATAPTTMLWKAPERPTRRHRRNVLMQGPAGKKGGLLQLLWWTPSARVLEGSTEWSLVTLLTKETPNATSVRM